MGKGCALATVSILAFWSSSMSLGSGSEPDLVFVSGVRGGGTKKSTFEKVAFGFSFSDLASGSSSIFLASPFMSVSERPVTP